MKKPAKKAPVKKVAAKRAKPAEPAIAPPPVGAPSPEPPPIAEDPNRVLRSTIERPSICRMVVVSRKDGKSWGFSADAPRDLPGVVIRVIDEASLEVECYVLGRVLKAKHVMLSDDDGAKDEDESYWTFGAPFVWTWPPRRG